MNATLEIHRSINGFANLNDLQIIMESEETKPLSDLSVELKNPNFKKVEIHFKNIEEKIVSKINRFHNGAIFGCVAWLTSPKILKALSTCKNVQIIVQKEEFLKPDSNSETTSEWVTQLRLRYQKLKCGLSRVDFREPICNLLDGYNQTVEAIRCVGNLNIDNSSSFSRSHHKFLVFCNFYKKNGRWKYSPMAIWTGSYNFSTAATRSFENVVYLETDVIDHPIMNAYLNEHHQIFALSESLDWESELVTPQYRMKT